MESTVDWGVVVSFEVLGLLDLVTSSHSSAFFLEVLPWERHEFDLYHVQGCEMVVQCRRQAEPPGFEVAPSEITSVRMNLEKWRAIDIHTIKHVFWVVNSSWKTWVLTWKPCFCFTFMTILDIDKYVFFCKWTKGKCLSPQPLYHSGGLTEELGDSLATHETLWNHQWHAVTKLSTTLASQIFSLLHRWGSLPLAKWPGTQTRSLDLNFNVF